jgi:hypothetical protein
VNSLNVTGLAHINELKIRLHLDHETTMLEQVGTKEVLQNEELLIEGVLCLGAVSLLDGLFPHAHELPFLELLEEAQLLDMVVGVTLDQPLAQGNKFNGDVGLVECKTFTGESVVLGVVAGIIGDDLEIVGVPIQQVRVQVHEDGLFLALAVEEQLDVFVEIAPHFRLCLLVSALVTSHDLRLHSLSWLIGLAEAGLRSGVLGLCVI